MAEAIVWTNERRKLGDLIPWPRNPRLIYEPEGKRLVKSYKEFAQAELILIEPDNGLLNGHQRLKVWAAEFGPSLEIEVRVSSRKLTEKEKEKLTIYLHKGTQGAFDMDLLSEWDVPDLIEWGFSEKDLQIDDVDFTVPEPKPQKEPELKAECLIEVYCSKGDLEMFRATLDEWSEYKGVTINIS